jgi:hypothetical protein
VGFKSSSDVDQASATRPLNLVAQHHNDILVVILWFDPLQMAKHHHVCGQPSCGPCQTESALLHAVTRLTLKSRPRRCTSSDTVRQIKI